MKTVKITLASGNTFTTRINATDEVIKRYYAIGSVTGFDNNDKITAVEILN